MTQVSALLPCAEGSRYGAVVRTDSVAIVSTDNGGVVRIVDGAAIHIVESLGVNQSETRTVAMNRTNLNRYPNYAPAVVRSISTTTFARQRSDSCFSNGLQDFLGSKTSTDPQ